MATEVKKRSALFAASASTPLLGSVNLVARDFLGLPPKFGLASGELYALMGGLNIVPVFSHAASNSIYTAFALCLMPSLLQLVVRSRPFAAACSWAILTTFFYLHFRGESWWFFVYMGLWAIVFLGTVLRLGLLPGIAMFFAFQIIMFIPFTTDMDRWYFPASTVGIIVIALVAGLGFYLSIHRPRRAFGYT